jgi:hypothetical protein
MRCIIAVLAAVSIAACSSGTAPTANVAGTWTLTGNTLTGAGTTCGVSATVQFVQNGSVLSGSLPGSGIVVNCTGSEVVVDTIVGTDVVTGSVNGANIVLQLASNTVVATGTVTGGNAMSGSMMTLSIPARGIDVTGAWSGSR